MDLTVTFADHNGCATSEFRAYCLAVGKSSDNHQTVVDYFLKEIETLSQGISVFCPREGRSICIQMALLAYIADRPARHALKLAAVRHAYHDVVDTANGTLLLHQKLTYEGEAIRNKAYPEIPNSI